MKPRRLWCLLALVASVSSCHDETVIVNNPGAVEIFSAPVPIAIGAVDDVAQAVDTGSDGQPRLVFKRGEQVLFTRRSSNGAWTTPLDLSVDDASVKSGLVMVVSRNNNFSHAFWLDAAGVHYARVNDAAVPAIEIPGDSVVSGVMPSNVTAPTPGFGPVSSIAATIDRASNNVFVAWRESLDPDTGDANGADEVPVVAAVAAGAGALGERFALVLPLSDATTTTCTLPRLEVSGAGVLHAIWSGPLGNGTGPGVRHRIRTAASAWSSDPNGELIYPASATAVTDLLLAGDGDAYAVFEDGGAGLALAAYRAVGAATLFGVAQTIDSATHVGLVAALEPGTEILHAFWHDGANYVETRNPSANLAGAWPVVPTTIMANAATGGVALNAWADSSNRVAVVFQGNGVAGGTNHVFGATRPTGSASLWTAPADLTAGYAAPAAGLSVARNVSGSAMVSWAQGDSHAIPLAEIFAVNYSTGGAWSVTTNVSESPAIGSHAPVLLNLSDSNIGHLFWRETVVTDTAHNIYYARKP